MKTWADYGIQNSGLGPEVYSTCPKCSHTRKKSTVRCLSVNLDKGCWICHHCAWSGSLSSGEDRTSRPLEWKPQVYRRPSFVATVPTDQLLTWFAERGISRAIVEQAKIRLTDIYFPQLEARVLAIVFPYLRGEQVVNCKYRALSNQPDGKKVFRQEYDAEKILYGVNDVEGLTLIITEGELDKLALDTAGVMSCVSVPDGAPPEGSKPSDRKFEYLVNCQAILEPLTKIVLAVDNDGPGKALEAELARRLGPERCWRVQWPEGCKDANDVLLNHGTEALRAVIEQAKPWPIDNVLFPIDLAEDIIALQRAAIPRGASTGWDGVNALYTVMPGELTIVTGIPGHGKSEFLDALLVNLSMQHGWSSVFCSPENMPVARHLSKLIEKHAGGSFYGNAFVPRLQPFQLATSLEFLNQHFAFMAPDESLTIEAVLQKAKALVFRRGIRGLVIDPWNEFDHRRGTGLSETEHVSASLGLIRRFARLYGVHVWVVAHPAKMARTDDGGYPVPRPYDISGSAHWYNRADNCLSIWRDAGGSDTSLVEVHVQKIRSKYVGTVGMAQIRWNANNGRFTDV